MGLKIGIVGTGNMGRTLGSLWAIAGHEVFFGARRQEAARDAAKDASTAGAVRAFYGSNDEAAAFSDVILYCVRSVRPSDVFTDLTNLTGKVVIDINNSSIPDDYHFRPVIKSLAEQLQENMPTSRIVKAFNTMASAVFELDREALQKHGVTVFIAGEDREAAQIVAQLANDLGLSPRYAGGIHNARILETLGDLIRYFIFSADLGPFATLNLDVLPSITDFRFATDARFHKNSRSQD